MNGDRLVASADEQLAHAPQVCLLEVAQGRMRNNNLSLIHI
jgi:hypothetical protein